MFELNIMSNKSYDKFSKWEKLNFVILETGIFFGFTGIFFGFIEN